MNESKVKRTLSYIKMLNNVSLASLKEADTTGEDYATTFKRNLEVEKKKRAPGAGRKTIRRINRTKPFYLHEDQLPISPGEVREAVDQFLNQSKIKDNE